MASQITLVGLGQIGASVGLALHAQAGKYRRVGHDRSPIIARQAEKLGAVDQISYNLPAAVRQADLVFLSEPLPQSRETLELIASDLKHGALVLDTAPARVSGVSFAARVLPTGRHYVALAPALNPAYLEETASGLDAARADLFKNSVVAITAPPGTALEAFDLASNLVDLLGASPLFVDAAELDGLLAASDLLPRLSAAALLNATLLAPGWRENRKFAGRAYAQATLPLAEAGSPQSLTQASLLDSANAVRVIDDLMNELYALRTALEEQNESRLLELLDQASKGRAAWLEQRRGGDPERLEGSPPIESALPRNIFGLPPRKPGPGSK
ncbi:MAG TPA: prephenate dehydrogenase/arogenate dehydrogenase family protein [Anaerolineaceae bacterium]|nr:prephenate dehydrogenase/arogenate dehydrogenase family protein [Anaerolineaceae bacterium]